MIIIGFTLMSGSGRIFVRSYMEKTKPIHVQKTGSQSQETSEESAFQMPPGTVHPAPSLLTSHLVPGKLATPDPEAVLGANHTGEANPHTLLPWNTPEAVENTASLQPAAALNEQKRELKAKYGPGKQKEDGTFEDEVFEVYAGLRSSVAMLLSMKLAPEVIAPFEADILAIEQEQSKTGNIREDYDKYIQSAQT